MKYCVWFWTVVFEKDVDHLNPAESNESSVMYGDSDLQGQNEFIGVSQYKED